MKAKPTRRFIFNVSDETYRRLRGVSKKSGVPMSELARRAITVFLKQLRA